MIDRLNEEVYIWDFEDFEDIKAAGMVMKRSSDYNVLLKVALVRMNEMRDDQDTSVT